MEIWTTFSPQKVSWELTTAQNKGKGGDSDWLKNLDLIKKSLLILKSYKISGIRLVIFPPDLIQDGEIFNWEKLNRVLSLTKQLNLKVDWCLGPFQYPYGPGIRIPRKFFPHFLEGFKFIDQDPGLRKYALAFLNEQLNEFAKDKRINGFFVSNEWPDCHGIDGLKEVKGCVSKDFMKEILSIVKSKTDKPINVNTNISIDQSLKLLSTFNELLDVVGKQGVLGLDIYPFRETWKRLPKIKFFRLFKPYRKRLVELRNKLKPVEVNFAEIEAQPWGSGQSWYEIIKSSPNPEKQIGTFKRGQLLGTYNHYIKETKIKKISLWGADFWLTAHEQGIKWPFEDVKNLSKMAIDST